jgi:ribosome-associated heat shock protein Hsp15
MPTENPKGAQRIDKWLYYTRVFKTRTLAGKFADSGKIRLTHGPRRDRISKASQMVREGDVLTFSLHNHIHILKVLLPGTRRGPAPEARTLYEDLSPERPSKQTAGAKDTSAPHREKGMGRPTKKDRRAFERLRDT